MITGIQVSSENWPCVDCVKCEAREVKSGQRRVRFLAGCPLFSRFEDGLSVKRLAHWTFLDQEALKQVLDCPLAAPPQVRTIRMALRRAAEGRAERPTVRPEDEIGCSLILVPTGRRERFRIGNRIVVAEWQEIR